MKTLSPAAPGRRRWSKVARLNLSDMPNWMLRDLGFEPGALVCGASSRYRPFGLPASAPGGRDKGDKS